MRCFKPISKTDWLYVSWISYPWAIVIFSVSEESFYVYPFTYTLSATRELIPGEEQLHFRLNDTRNMPPSSAHPNFSFDAISANAEFIEFQFELFQSLKYHHHLHYKCLLSAWIPLTISPSVSIGHRHLHGTPCPHRPDKCKFLLIGHQQHVHVLENIAFQFVLIFPAMLSISCLFYLDGL